MQTAEKKHVIIDTDPGIDDALAFLLALASPEIEVEALTTVAGNCRVEDTTRNALCVLDLVHANTIPVARGVERPLIQTLQFSGSVHGDTGLGYAVLSPPSRKAAPLHAVNMLIEKILAAPGDITLVAIGPLTNVALAIRREPRVAKLVKEVVIMGGAIKVPGNVTPQAEFNIHSDPHAAAVVFHSGMPLTLVPLDVTSQVILTGSDIAKLRKIPSPIARFVADSNQQYLEFHQKVENFDGCLVHDPLALAVAFAPDLVQTQDLYVDVDISGGVSMGCTFADFFPTRSPRPNMKVALEVDSKRFISMLLERVNSLCQQFPD
jgi:purine nucleosidase